MLKINPNSIFLYSVGCGNKFFSMHLTTNPEPEGMEAIGTKAQIEKKLRKFQYFDLEINDADSLEALIEVATSALKRIRNVTRT